MIIPVMIELRDWAHSLLQDFPRENVPQLINVDKWKEWGNSLGEAERFAALDIPRTDAYADWRQWAFRVYEVLS